MNKVLTIAGSDPSGGAGIQADIKAISATGSYAASAITAVTVQNTKGVEEVFPIPPEYVFAQISCVISDIKFDAVKIGMLHSSEVIDAVAHALTDYKGGNIVLDPVMVSTSGHRLIEESAVERLCKCLIPKARVITPNVPEAEILLEHDINSQAELREAALELGEKFHVSVLMKAGHMKDEMLVDIFYNAETGGMLELPSPRIETKNTHGTGCTLSSALASYIAQGLSLDDAVRAAKEYIAKAIAAGADVEIGRGHGPVDHFFFLR